MNKMFFLISHNKLAQGMKEAIEMIAGPKVNLQAFGLMPGDHPETVIKQIETQITKDMEVVILGDIAGGSVCNAAMRLTSLSNVVLVAGTNLPLALEIVINQVTSEKAIEALIAEDKEAMKLLNVAPASEDSFEDFF